MLKGGWLFPGLDPVDPLSTRQLNRAIHATAEAAHIAVRRSSAGGRNRSRGKGLPATGLVRVS
jgi:hypothetical protein